MKVYIVYEYDVIEHEERFRLMSVHSSVEKAKDAIHEYEEIAKKWKSRSEYHYEEYIIDKSYYNNN